MEQSSTKNILVLYHGFCMDGFGAAYAAWKKFGDSAEYLHQERTKVPSASELEGKEVYVVDYAFSKEVMLSFEKVAKKFVCIDHHISAKEAIQSLKEHVFDLKHSGAYLAWQYFNPNTPIPKLIEYISDADTWTHQMPDWEYIDAYIYRDDIHKFSFPFFEKLEKDLDNEDGYNRAKEVGKLLCGSHSAKVVMYESEAEIISFEGHSIYAVNAPREIRSELGHVLAEKTKTFSMVFTYEKGYWKCSLRSVNDFDVSEIAKKFGGGGHKNAAGFTIPTNFPISFHN